MKDFIISLFSGFFGIVFAGFIVWAFQFKKIEKTEKAKVYVKRVQDKEDEFYKYVLSAHESLYDFNKAAVYNNPTQYDFNVF